MIQDLIDIKVNIFLVFLGIADILKHHHNRQWYMLII